MGKQFLKQVQAFSALADDELEMVARSGSEKRYRENEVIIHADDVANSLFVLKSGSAKISISDRNGREDILNIIHPLDFFGEMSILDSQSRSATVTAMEKCTTFIIEKERFLGLVKKYPQIALNMLVILCSRVRKTNGKIASLRFADAHGKMARVLLDILDASRASEAGKMVINLTLSRQELAALGGVTRETATRVLADFQKNGCIEVGRKKITLLDEAALRRRLL